LFLCWQELSDNLRRLEQDAKEAREATATLKEYHTLSAEGTRPPPEVPPVSPVGHVLSSVWEPVEHLVASVIDNICRDDSTRAENLASVQEEVSRTRAQIPHLNLVAGGGIPKEAAPSEPPSPSSTTSFDRRFEGEDEAEEDQFRQYMSMSMGD